MTEQQFKTKATEMIKRMVDTVADKKYTELAAILPPNPSWASFCKAEPTSENACLGFGEWLDGQLAMWEEEEDKKFVVDPFDASCLGEMELEEDNTSFVTYCPTSMGEELDFWFEIQFEVKDETVTAFFDVNI